MSNKISDERKALYYLGLVLMVLGFIMFISTFFTFARGDVFDMSGGSMMVTPVIGMIFMIVGGILRGIGEKGAAGSGLLLDPEKAREDLKPHSVAKGKMINDAVENIDLVKKMGETSQGKEIIKIRCRNCGQLNDEDAKFCKSCGREV